MGKRNWEPILFAVVAVLVALWLTLRAFFTPFHRLRSKVGSWEEAWRIFSQESGHWTVAVLARAVLALLLFWLALRCRRLGRAPGYLALAGAALAMIAVDLVLWAEFQLG